MNIFKLDDYDVELLERAITLQELFSFQQVLKNEKLTIITL